jgi:hypothetical protein
MGEGFFLKVLKGTPSASSQVGEARSDSQALASSAEGRASDPRTTATTGEPTGSVDNSCRYPSPAACIEGPVERLAPLSKGLVAHGGGPRGSSVHRHLKAEGAKGLEEGNKAKTSSPLKGLGRK